MRAETLGTLVLGDGEVLLAEAVRAGRWVFAGGLMAQDATGFPEEIARPGLPHHGLPPREREAERVMDRLGDLLGRAGAGLGDVVRLDQFYPSVAPIAAWQRVRRRRLGGHAPSSTSVVVRSLLLPEAGMEVSAIAALPQHGAAIAAAEPGGGVPPSPVLGVGDLVFVSGQLATPDAGAQLRDGLPEEALVPPATFWGGDRIRRETDYVMRHRVVPALARGGASLAGVARADVYLSEPEDVAGFLAAWRDWFAGRPPATTLVMAEPDGIGLKGARVEITLLAVRDGAPPPERVEAPEVVPAIEGVPAAMRVGDLLLVSGLLANDGDGLIRAARRDPRRPFYGCPTTAEAETIAAKAERVCAAAGTTLGNALRIRQAHADLDGFHALHTALRRCAGGAALPFSALGAGPAMPVPGATMQLDLWVWAPR